MLCAGTAREIKSFRGPASTWQVQGPQVSQVLPPVPAPRGKPNTGSRGSSLRGDGGPAHPGANSETVPLSSQLLVTSHSIEHT